MPKCDCENHQSSKVSVEVNTLQFQNFFQTILALYAHYVFCSSPENVWSWTCLRKTDKAEIMHPLNLNTTKVL